MKLKKGDQVIVTIGKDRGKQGKVEQILPDRYAVVVTGVNQYKRHEKKKDQSKPGGIIERAYPLHMGKVALVCPSCHKPTRVGFLLTKNDKVRICRKCKQKI